MSSGVPGVPETLPGKLQSQNECFNNSKMLFGFFIDDTKAIVMKTDALTWIKTNYTHNNCIPYDHAQQENKSHFHFIVSLTESWND